VLAASPGVTDELAPEQVLDLNSPDGKTNLNNIARGMAPALRLEVDSCTAASCPWMRPVDGWHMLPLSASQKHMNWDEG
jgi:hypothetical protein